MLSGILADTLLNPMFPHLLTLPTQYLLYLIHHILEMIIDKIKIFFKLHL